MLADNVIAFPATEDTTESQQAVLLKPGTYLAVYVRHRGQFVFRQVKLRVDFRLVEHAEIVLPRWYRITGYKQRISAASAHSDIVREVSAVLGTRVRRDRIPLASLANVVVNVEVDTVKVDQKQELLHETGQYSVITRVKGKA